MIIALVAIGCLAAQQKEAKDDGYDFQISEMDVPKWAPDGFESVKTVSLNKPLYPEKAYKVGFWIFGPQLPDRSYSYPIHVFPSNGMGSVDREIFDMVESKDIMPALTVDPPPSYTSKGHYTFIIRPDTLYNQITVALKVSNQEQPPIDIRNDITVTGVFVSLLPDTLNSKPVKKIDRGISLKTPEVATPGTIAERVLIDSSKRYAVRESSVLIGLYDHRNIDKDRVTIYLNEQILVEDYELKRKKKFFKAHLNLGINIITLHAENLGEVSPNTAAIIIKSRSQEFMAVLESNLGASQYFTLVYEPK